MVRTNTAKVCCLVASVGLAVAMLVAFPGCEGGFEGGVSVPIGNPNTNVNVTTGNTNVNQNQTNTQTQTTTVNVEQHTTIGNDKQEILETGLPAPTPVPTPQPQPGELGTIAGSVVNALDGSPLGDAEVKVMNSELSVLTDRSGTFTIEGVPAGEQGVSASLQGYVLNGQTVTVVAAASVEVTIGLVPLSRNITAVLTWGAEPSDLDLHVSGPDVESATTSTGRFHVAYYALNPVTYAFLDLDDVTSFGPETGTIHPQPSVDAAEDAWPFVAGSYHVWVHNYSRVPEFDVSQARVILSAGDTQIGEYLIGDAVGDVADDIWNVVDFDVSDSGVVSNVTVIQTITTGDQNTLN